MIQASGAAASPEDAVRFGLMVDRMVAAAAPACATFHELVLALPGVLPDEVLASLRRTPSGVHAQLAEDAPSDCCGPLVDQVSELPLPHPLDSEYRFDDDTACRLARMLIEATRPGDEILLVGTPTVALALARSSDDRRLRFVGADDCVTDALSAACGAGLAVGPSNARSAAAALIDPPWYLAPMEAMTSIAAAGCRPESPLWLVVPTDGARPQAFEDRKLFVRSAVRLGLRPTGASLAVRYRSPFFELAALSRQGIGRLPSWRVGDAMEFRTGGIASIVAGSVSPRPCELTIAGVRLRVVHGSGDRHLAALHPGEVFPSVSSRAPGRAAATIWTSGNRAFSIDPATAREGLARLAECAADLWPQGLEAHKIDPPDASVVAHSGSLIHDLAGLVEREFYDARQVVGDGAWRQTGMDWRY